jgi:hypothetical protein
VQRNRLLEQLDEGLLSPHGLDLVSASAGSGKTASGVIADQGALNGVLARIRDLGLPLVAVRRVSAQDGLSRADECPAIQHGGARVAPAEEEAM